MLQLLLASLSHFYQYSFESRVLANLVFLLCDILICTLMIWYSRLGKGLLTSPELFPVFWSILVMLYFEYSLLVLWFLSLPGPLPILLGIVPSAPTTASITVTFIFHRFFSTTMLKFLGSGSNPGPTKFLPSPVSPWLEYKHAYIIS